MVDLFLANASDRMPILCEVKRYDDQCSLYALIQLLTQASCAATPAQRDRLVLFGSQLGFVLREAIPGKPTELDLYILLVEPKKGIPHDDPDQEGDGTQPEADSRSTRQIKGPPNRLDRQKR